MLTGTPKSCLGGINEIETDGLAKTATGTSECDGKEKQADGSTRFRQL
jgi:hypothetical protein